MTFIATLRNHFLSSDEPLQVLLALSVPDDACTSLRGNAAN